MASITVEHAIVEFSIRGRSRTLFSNWRSAMTGGAINVERGVVRALDDISITLAPGDRVGLIGHNGAGKTTLLRLLAGVYTPVSGRVEIHGRVSTLFNTLPGLEPMDTGYRNIINCALYLGMSRREIREKFDDIAALSDLGPYLGLPVRTYSSGMTSRLGFAIATAIEPEILLIDENIGTGDAAFTARAQGRVEELAERSGLVVLASHSIALLKRLCRTGVLLEEGRIVGTGPIGEVFDLYRERVIKQAQESREGLARALDFATQSQLSGQPVSLELEEQSLRAALIDAPRHFGHLVRLCEVISRQGRAVPEELGQIAVEVALEGDSAAGQLIHRLCQVLRQQSKAVPFALEERALLAALEEKPEEGRTLQKLCTLYREHQRRVPPELEERAVRALLREAPGKLKHLVRLCELVALQGRPIPQELERKAVEAALAGSTPDSELDARLCQVLQSQCLPVPFALEERVLITALERKPESSELLDRLCGLHRKHFGGVPLELEERALWAIVAEQPQFLSPLVRLCEVVVRRTGAIPETLERQAIETARGSGPEEAPMLNRLCQVLREHGCRVPADLSARIQ